MTDICESALERLDTKIDAYWAIRITTSSATDSGVWSLGSGKFVGAQIDRDGSKFLELDRDAKIHVDWAEVQQQHARYVADPVGSGVHAAICALLWSARMSWDSAS